MAYVVGREHFINFRIIDINSVPVDGLSLTDFVSFFTVDDLSISTSTVGLAIVGQGNGQYVATYVPNAPGYYYLSLYNTANDVRILDAQEIDDSSTLAGGSNVVLLNQDFGGVGALKPTVTNPQLYVLLVYNSSDWAAGRQSTTYSIGMTGLDINGNWLTTPITVVHGTYHIVIMSNTVTTVIMPYLEV